MNVRTQRDRFLAFAFASADLLIETNAQGEVRFAIGAAGPLGEENADDMVGKKLDSFFEARDKALIDHFVAYAKPGRRIGPSIARIKTSSKSVSISACCLPGAADSSFLSLAYAAPVATRAATAERDEHTGLIKAEAFDDIAIEAVKQARHSGREAQMTLFTVDGQNDLLERMDEAAGDAFLSKVGAILREASIGDAATQVSDGKYSFVHDSSFDTSVASDDIASYAKKADPTGAGVSISSQSMSVDGGLSAEDAARALTYTLNAFTDGAAASGDMSIHSMNDALDGMMRETSARMAEFKKAISDGQFRFVAQPVVDLQSRRLSHYELLVRFVKDESPFEMVSFAEKTGIIADLDFAAVQAAIRFLGEWANSRVPGLAVNISGFSIVNEVFLKRLTEQLTSVPFSREKLHFEITESSEIADLAAADEAIHQLRKQGHRVYLDDFGAGSASFRYLRALDVDGVKIDGDYVSQALKIRRDALLLKAMTSLCRDLEVRTVAEMIENESQIDHLRKLGVDYGQGYLFGRPEPLSSIVENAGKRKNSISAA